MTNNDSHEAHIASPEHPAPAWRDIALDQAIDQIVLEDARSGGRSGYISTKGQLVDKSEVVRLLNAAHSIYNHMFDRQRPDLSEESRSLDEREKSLESDLESTMRWQDSESQEKAVRYHEIRSAQYPEELELHKEELRRYEGFQATLGSWRPGPEFSGLKSFVEFGLARAVHRHVDKAPIEPQEMGGEEFKAFMLDQYRSELQAIKDRLAMIYVYWGAQDRLSSELDNSLI